MITILNVTNLLVVKKRNGPQILINIIAPMKEVLLITLYQTNSAKTQTRHLVYYHSIAKVQPAQGVDPNDMKSYIPTAVVPFAAQVIIKTKKNP